MLLFSSRKEKWWPNKCYITTYLYKMVVGSMRKYCLLNTQSQSSFPEPQVHSQQDKNIRTHLRMPCQPLVELERCCFHPPVCHRPQLYAKSYSYVIISLVSTNRICISFKPNIWKGCFFAKILENMLFRILYSQDINSN